MKFYFITELLKSVKGFFFSKEITGVHLFVLQVIVGLNLALSFLLVCFELINK